MKRSWLPIMTVASALLLVCVHGCGSDQPSAAVPGNSGFSGVQTGACSNEGETAPCHSVIGQHDGYVDCFNATQTCTNGTWGACGALGGTVSTHAYTPKLDSAGPDDGSLSTLSLSTPTACVTNPCNPGCLTFNEVPATPIAPVCPFTGGACAAAGGYPALPATSRLNLASCVASTAACPATQNGADTTPNCDGCNYDTHCSAGTCSAWASGGFDAAPAGVDLTLEYPCLDTLGGSAYHFSVCNRGATALTGTGPTVRIGGYKLTANTIASGAPLRSQCVTTIPSPPDDKEIIYPLAGVPFAIAPGACVDVNNTNSTSTVSAADLNKPGEPFVVNWNKSVAETNFCNNWNAVTPSSCTGTCGGGSGSACGNSMLNATEQCDDGNTTNSDGCSSTCKLEVGFKCPTPGSACTAAICGNGIVEGLEQCDDGPWAADSTGVVKDRPYDGCYKCQNEVQCPVGAGPGPTPCTAVCGDGLLFPGEGCDDGNTANGDGCSSTCMVEAGSTCISVTAAAPAFLDVPVIYRDRDTFGCTASSPDFQETGCADIVPHGLGNPGPPAYGLSQGIPAVGLSTVDREPTFLASVGVVLNATSFNTWYHDGPLPKLVLGKFIRLPSIAAGTYQFDSSADPAYNLPNINCGNATPTTTCASVTGFYPLNGLGWGNQSAGRNYSFTSEARFPFTYAGGEVLSFTGDDDVFVYIGGRKVVDIGGIHGALSSSVTLSSPSVTSPASASATPPLTLVAGQTYEIAVFQAERATTGSNYKLTLSGFNRKISVCTPPTPPPPPASTSYTQVYTSSCPKGYGASWDLLGYSATLTGSSTISFGAQTGPTVAGPWLPSPTPAAVASAPVPDPAICTLTGPGPTCPKSLGTPLGTVNAKQADLLLTVNLSSSCGTGSIGGMTTSDGTAACPGPGDPAACTTNDDCWEDFHCSGTSCVWNGTSGYKDPACPGIDLTINSTCNAAGVDQMLACNRGNTKVNAGQTIKVAIANNGPGGNSAGCPGCGTACSVTLASALLPGTCVSVSGCGIQGNRHAYVNWDNSITECNYKNNESSAKNNGGGCPAICGVATSSGAATLNSWNVTYTCVANE